MNGNVPVNGYFTGALAVRKVHTMYVVLFNRDNLPTAYVKGVFATKEEAGEYAKSIYRESQTPWVVLPYIYYIYYNG